MQRPTIWRRSSTTARSTSGSSGTRVDQNAWHQASCSQMEKAPEIKDRGTATAVRRVLIVVLVLNTVVLVTKNVVAVRTGALAVLGAALESGLDVLGSLMGILLVAVATQAPDEDHPYGHAKFETLGTLGIVGFLSISCFELLREGISALINGPKPHAITRTDIAFIASTLIVNVHVVWYERRRGRQLNSAFLIADA